MKLYTLVLMSLVFLASCNTKPDETVALNDAAKNQVTVKEILQASAYTYLYVNDGEKDLWLAVTKMDAQVGDQYYYDGAMEMSDFKSKDLDRTFESVLFVQAISKDPILKDMQENGSKQIKEVVANENIHVETPEGGISIGDLISNKSEYDQKTVIVSGQVVKYNPAIMEKNWIHLQDGTGEVGTNDLTITTQFESKVGDVITIEGVVTLDKDFGAGYAYEIIIEDATLKQ